MLRRFLFRWHKTILSTILWMCLMAIWVRSNTHPGEEDESQHSRRHQRRISHVNDLAKFDQQHDLVEDVTPKQRDGIARHSKIIGPPLSPLLKSRQINRQSRNYRLSPNDPQANINKNPVVDIHIESNSYSNFGEGGVNERGEGQEDSLLFRKGERRANTGDAGEEHLGIDSINQQILEIIKRGDESVKQFDTASDYERSGLDDANMQSNSINNQRNGNIIKHENVRKSSDRSAVSIRRRGRLSSFPERSLPGARNENSVVVEGPIKREPLRHPGSGTWRQPRRSEYDPTQLEYLRQQGHRRQHGDLKLQESIAKQDSSKRGQYPLRPSDTLRESDPLRPSATLRESDPLRRNESLRGQDVHVQPDSPREGVDNGQMNDPSHQRPGPLVSSNTCVVDGVYWTQEFLRLLPKGIEAPEADKWLKNIRNSRVRKLESPHWNKCGRPKNGFAVLEDGSGVCARYRSPNTRLVQGEILSYWLARYLGFTTVPPVALSLVNSGQWSDVSEDVRRMEWDADQFVALIMWMENVDSSPQSKVFMPQPILTSVQTGIPLSLRTHRTEDTNGCGRSSGGLDLAVGGHGLVVLKYLDMVTASSSSSTSGSHPNNVTVTMDTLIQIAQWGNLIIFDYLTANYDRVASMQDSADKEHQPSILAEAIRNLHKSTDSSLLWLLDNESGLLDAYELMYRGGRAGWRFHTFHQTMLRTMCIFDKQVIDKIRDLYGFEEPGAALEELAQEEEPSLSYIKSDNSRVLFGFRFKSRLKDILDWVKECQGRLVV